MWMIAHYESFDGIQISCFYQENGKVVTGECPPHPTKVPRKWSPLARDYSIELIFIS